MTRVCLRSITPATFRECIRLDVHESQRPFVAPNQYSLAQVAVNPRLTAFAIYDGDLIGRDLQDSDEMVGFCMYQVMDGVAFVTRLMIDQRFQRRGYGRAAMEDLIRRFQRIPGIEVIATSVHRENPGALALYRSLGFVDNPMMDDPNELYLLLDWPPGTVEYVRSIHPRDEG